MQLKGTNCGSNLPDGHCARDCPRMWGFRQLRQPHSHIALQLPGICSSCSCGRMHGGRDTGPPVYPLALSGTAKTSLLGVVTDSGGIL